MADLEQQPVDGDPASGDLSPLQVEQLVDEAGSPPPSELFPKKGANGITVQPSYRFPKVDVAKMINF